MSNRKSEEARTLYVERREIDRARCLQRKIARQSKIVWRKAA